VARVDEDENTEPADSRRAEHPQAVALHRPQFDQSGSQCRQSSRPDRFVAAKPADNRLELPLEPILPDYSTEIRMTAAIGQTALHSDPKYAFRQQTPLAIS